MMYFFYYFYFFPLLLIGRRFGNTIIIYLFLFAFSDIFPFYIQRNY